MRAPLDAVIADDVHLPSLADDPGVR